MYLRTLTSALLVTLAATTVACDGGPSSSNPPPTSDPGIRITAGDQVVDSIDAMPMQTLVVQVIGPNGRPASGAVVQFESVLKTTGTMYPAPTVWIAPAGTSEFNKSAADTTDVEGHASIQVRLGRQAGPGSVTVTVPAHGYVTTAAYTIQPGAPVSVTVAPEDTTLYVGRSVEMRTSVTDRVGNPRMDAVTFAVASGRIALGDGKTLTATAIGRGVVVAQVQGLADTSYVSMIPEGTIAGYTNFFMELHTFNLDGSGMTLLAEASAGSGYIGEMPAAWSADGRSLVYHDSRSDHTRWLYSVDVAAGTRTRLITAPAGVTSEAWPQRSRDGQWIYFNGQYTFWGGSQLFRVRSDGTGLERINTSETFAFAGYASPSPDGTRLAFLTNRDSSTGGLHVLDLATGQSIALNVVAATPRWSPNGDLIAYVAVPSAIGSLDHHVAHGAGELRVVRPDGTGARMVTRSPNMFLPGIDWSPDGKYLIGSGQNGAALTVVEVATGEEVVIRLPKNLRAPTWRP